MDEANLSADPTRDSKQKPHGDPTVLVQSKYAVQETGESNGSEEEPLPPEFLGFIAGVREFFRELKKFVIFIRNSKNYNASMLAVTLLLAIGTFTQACIYRIQLRPMRISADAANKSADVAARELELSQRPWVKDDSLSIISPLLVTENGIAVTLEYRLSNLGHSPAINVDFGAYAILNWLHEGVGPIAIGADLGKGTGEDSMVWPAIEGLPKGLNSEHVESASVVRMLCDEVFEMESLENTEGNLAEQLKGQHIGTNFMFTGTAIFPNDAATGDYRLLEREQSLKKRPPDGGSYMVTLTSCIQYRSPPDNTLHHEQAVYFIEGINPGSIHRFSLNPDGKPIPASRLFLHRRARYAD